MRTPIFDAKKAFRVLLVSVAPIWLAALAACGETGPPVPSGESAPPAEQPEADPGALEAIHDRAFVFLSRDPDSTIVVPWLFQAELRERLDVRRRDVWFGREGGWERLVAEADSMPERRAPWNILPGRTVRIVVGDGGGLETLILRDPARPLEVSVGIPLAQWTGPGEESLRFHRATATLPSADVEGYLLDLSAVRAADDGGDWIFLQGGEELQAAFVEQVGESGSRTRSRHRAWTRWAVRENHWPDVIVEWTEVSPFERARRDIPLRWTIRSAGGEIQGELEAVGHALEVGIGEGVVLPVHGFFLVEGELRLGADAFRVTGTVRHRQRQARP